ncbi:TapB family protein [Parabacteroides sp.]
MKRNILTLLVSLFVMTASAQISYYVPPKGKVMVYAAKTEKGQTVSLTKQYLKASSTSNNYVIVSEVYQAPTFTKLDGRTELAYRLENGVLYTDPTQFFSQSQNATMKYVNELKRDIIFPVNPKIGEKLEGCSLKCYIEGEEGEEGILMTATISNRIVAAKESITTPAGTFECLRYDYDVTNEIMGRKMKSFVRTWYAKDYGMIKLEMSLEGKKIISNFVLERIENRQ